MSTLYRDPRRGRDVSGRIVEQVFSRSDEQPSTADRQYEHVRRYYPNGQVMGERIRVRERTGPALLAGRSYASDPPAGCVTWFVRLMTMAALAIVAMVAGAGFGGSPWWGVATVAAGCAVLAVVCAAGDA
jgi:hypothetical protein